MKFHPPEKIIGGNSISQFEQGADISSSRIEKFQAVLFF